MEQPVDHDHLEHRTRPRLGDAFAVHAGRIEGSKVHARDAVYEFWTLMRSLVHSQ